MPEDGDKVSEQVGSEAKPEEAHSINSLDDLSEHKLDLSKEIEGKTDAEVLDFIISKDEDDLVPWESVQLPSQGVYYEGAVPGGMVKVRPMGIYLMRNSIR